MPDAPTLEDIRAAQARIAGHVTVTPLLASDELDQLVGSRVLLKAESLQRTGSFKIRGALNRLLQLTADERSRGVVAWSSGNHAQGIAAAAAIVGTRATIVMPADAPKAKLDNTRALGASVVTYDRVHEDREAIAYCLARKDGLVVVPAFDDFDVIAGQGTLGLELIEQCRSLQFPIEDVLVPVSGGGLIAGVGVALAARPSGIRLYSVEPQGYDDHRRSFMAGAIVRNPSAAVALCDALLAPVPGKLTWPINQERLSGGYAVADKDVVKAIRYAFERLKLVVEPGGAAALAAVLSSHHRPEGRTTIVVLSGGNVDAATMAQCLAP